MGLSNFFIESFGRANVIQEFYPPGTSDFSSYIATARARGVDVFMSPTIVGDAQLIIDQIVMQNLNIPILAGDTWDNNVIVQGASGRNIRLYVSTFYAEGASPQFDAGLKAYINSNPLALVNNGGNDLVAASTAVGFDSYNVALEAFRRAGTTNPARVLEGLRGVEHQGVTGFIQFDGIGDRVMDFAFVKRLNTQQSRWENMGQVFAR
jgi:branched-chain amino acid transport system substrate-binding protein